MNRRIWVVVWISEPQLGTLRSSKVVSTHLWNTALNLYQQAEIRDSFHSSLGGLVGVCCNFLGDPPFLFWTVWPWMAALSSRHQRVRLDDILKLPETLLGNPPPGPSTKQPKTHGNLSNLPSKWMTLEAWSFSRGIPFQRSFKTLKLEGIGPTCLIWRISHFSIRFHR